MRAALKAPGGSSHPGVAEGGERRKAGDHHVQHLAVVVGRGAVGHTLRDSKVVTRALGVSSPRRMVAPGPQQPLLRRLVEAVARLEPSGPGDAVTEGVVVDAAAGRRPHFSSY